MKRRPPYATSGEGGQGEAGPWEREGRTHTGRDGERGCRLGCRAMGVNADADDLQMTSAMS